jgi:signal peptidase I
MAPSENSKKKPQKQEVRDPAEERAEVYRVAAQRETVEAFVVAFILALLFRGFLAEAFVIPTGSMAPTLMGAHKDLVCDDCGESFQVGASHERSSDMTSEVVIAGVCPNCRHVNALDLVNEANDATFNGDRILVSKYSYTIHDPERWDVIVFKFPGNPKQNYIKRLVGLPNETLTIRHGDVYMRPTGSNQTPEILRKPPEKLVAMGQLVYDSEHQPQTLINANYPCRWQPWREDATQPPTDSWQVNQSADGFSATLAAKSNDQHWLRYYHRWPSNEQWQQAKSGGSLVDVDPYSSRAITDFYAYGSYVMVNAGMVYDKPPSAYGGTRLERILNGGFSQGIINPNYQPGVGLEQFDNSRRSQVDQDGNNWVGDLIVQSEIETSAESTELLLEIVEAGVKYRCTFDLKTGTATLTIDDIEPRLFAGETPASGPGSPMASTSVTAGSQHELRFSNCDDQLLLWVDGEVIEFDRPTTFDARQFRSDADNHPQYLPAHPLDAAPVAIAVRGGTSTIRSLSILRDKYYISPANSHQIVDYDPYLQSEFQRVFAEPEQWSTSQCWQSRRTMTFELAKDQFFPMGDNSPESLDARIWAHSKQRIPMPRNVNEDAWKWSAAHYVPRDLLVGKALVVFWPHSWNRPVPFTPNFSRFKLIR